MNKKPLPAELFNVSLPKLQEIGTNKDASFFMLELYESLQSCIINLNTIKRLNDEN